VHDDLVRLFAGGRAGAARSVHCRASSLRWAMSVMILGSLWWPAALAGRSGNVGARPATGAESYSCCEASSNAARIFATAPVTSTVAVSMRISGSSGGS
jgi:hypothetical protein